MDNVYLNYTCINITHKLDSIVKSDNIFVISEGEVKEKGKHVELMEITNGHYKRMFEI